MSVAAEVAFVDPPVLPTVICSDRLEISAPAAIELRSNCNTVRMIFTLLLAGIFPTRHKLPLKIVLGLPWRSSATAPLRNSYAAWATDGVAVAIRIPASGR